MDGLLFDTSTSPTRSDPARADIACFVGFVAPRRRGARLRAVLERAIRDLGWSGPSLPPSARVLPANVLPGGDSAHAFARWLSSIGWQPDRNGLAAGDLFARAAGAVLTPSLVRWWIEHAWLTPFSGRSAADLLELVDVPVPIDSWDAFDALFAWDQRPLVDNRVADTTMGAAVRRFFLAGGRKCYAVAIDDPWPLFTPLSARSDLRARLLPEFVQPTPVDRSTWRGVAHLFGLPEASFLCIPDLPELCAADVGDAAEEAVAEGDERFVECATRIVPETGRSLRGFPVSRSDEAGYAEWAALVGRVATLLQRHCREVQFIATVPLPVDERALGTDRQIVSLPEPERLAERRARVFHGHVAQVAAIGTIQTAFVQLIYPWLTTRESALLPGALEPPDGLLAGVLANNALTLGTWRSVARQPVAGVLALEPMLSPSELGGDLAYHGTVGQRRLTRSLRDRVSIVAPTSTGFQLLSDVTTDDDEAYRPANVNRLVAAIVRAARLMGESAVFTNSGEALWRRLRSGLEDLLLGLWGEGAFSGASSADAFGVRCDRSTMTQADLDAGRAIVRVEFTAASPVEHITVIFSMDDGGLSTIAPAAAGAAPVA